jgi:hypothetical protein
MVRWAMREPRRGPATYADVLAAPPEQVAEVIDGALFVRPRPALQVAFATTALSMVLGPRYQLGLGGPGGWIFLFEPELHLGPDVLVPDMAGWPVAGAVSGELTAAYATTAPTWVWEVLSPSTARLDRVVKLPKYHAAGVGHAVARASI